MSAEFGDRVRSIFPGVVVHSEADIAKVEANRVNGHISGPIIPLDTSGEEQWSAWTKRTPGILYLDGIAQVASEVKTEGRGEVVEHVLREGEPVYVERSITRWREQRTLPAYQNLRPRRP